MGLDGLEGLLRGRASAIRAYYLPLAGAFLALASVSFVAERTQMRLLVGVPRRGATMRGAVLVGAFAPNAPLRVWHLAVLDALEGAPWRTVL